jgi:hypothetical protein
MSKRLRSAGLVLLAILAPIHGRVLAQERMSGTYRIWQCLESCAVGDSSRAVASATIVLLGKEIDAKTKAALDSLGSFWLSGSNACFAVRSSAPSQPLKSFFGIIRAASSTWTSGQEYTTLPVYRSPDAGYQLRFIKAGSGLNGEGWSMGSSGQPWHRDAYIVGIRIGEPDVRACHE